VIYLCRELKLCIVFKNLHIRESFYCAFGHGEGLTLYS
jgi:hypothetical protein